MIAPPLRGAAVRAACWLIAIGIGAPLLWVTAPEAGPTAAPKIAHRVRVHVKPPPAVAESREQIRIDVAKPTEKVAVRKQAPAARPAKLVVKAVEPEPLDKTPVVSTVVPELEIAKSGLETKKPPVPDDDMPAPAHYDDAPGGNVAVVALKIDSEGSVTATDILVASNSPLNDLTFAMSSLHTKLTKVDPPIPPGQFRWIEIRLDYTNTAEKSNILP